jgi:hypothetical protein
MRSIWWNTFKGLGTLTELYDVVSPAKILDDVNHVWDLAIDFENFPLRRGWGQSAGHVSSPESVARRNILEAGDGAGVIVKDLDFMRLRRVHDDSDKNEQ